MIKYGPNIGKEFPSKYHVQNFNYNGFMCQLLKGFSKWKVKSFLRWTEDPGIGLFNCSDGMQRLIPSGQLSPEYYKELPKSKKLKPFKGIGVLFGQPSTSLK